MIEVGALSTVTGLSKIAANVISPLADVGVSVFCLSSNQEDYVMVCLVIGIILSHTHIDSLYEGYCTQSVS